MLNYPASLDIVFHALSDPTRRQFVDRMSRGPATVSELAKPVSMSLPAVVQHLKVLEASGIMRSEKVGRVRTCRIDPGSLRMVEQWVAERRAVWEQHFDQLGDVLKELAREETRN
jgi:DNA-binding transcriptional ArsR family regulator